MMMYTTNMPRTSKAQIKERHADLFAEVVTRTGSPKAAIIAIEPELANKPAYAANKGLRMMRRSDVQEKIQKKLEIMQPKALKRIKELVMSDDEAIATANSWKVVEHLRGKPVGRNLNINASASIEDALSD